MPHHEDDDFAPIPQAPDDNVVIVRYNGHEVVYALTEPNYGTGEFEGSVPPWARAMGILHALRYILEVKELESILSIACARMRKIKQLEQTLVDLGGITRG